MCTWEQSGLEVPALNKDVPAWFWFFCCFFFQQPPHIALPQEGHAEGGPAAEPQGDRAGAARGHPPTQRNEQHRAPQSPAELFGSLHFGISLQPTWPAFPKRSETHFPSVCGTPRSLTTSPWLSLPLGPNFYWWPSFANALHLFIPRLAPLSPPHNAAPTQESFVSSEAASQELHKT